MLSKKRKQLQFIKLSQFREINKMPESRTTMWTVLEGNKIINKSLMKNTSSCIQTHGNPCLAILDTS